MALPPTKTIPGSWARFSFYNRDLYAARLSTPEFQNLKLLFEEVIRNPEAEQFGLTGGLAKVFRVKKYGVILDYLVNEARIRIIRITLCTDNPNDGCQVLARLVNVGESSQGILAAVGFPTALIRAKSKTLSASLQ